MRRVSPERQEWLNGRTRRLHRWRMWEANFRARRRRIGKTIDQRVLTSVLLVPEVLTAETSEYRGQILTLLDRMGGVLNRPNTRVKLDFSRVRKVYPGGMLVLLAFLELLLELFPGRIAARCPPGAVTGQLLKHFGVAEELGVVNVSDEPMLASVVEWRYLTGRQAAGQEVKQLLDEYRAVCDADIPEGLFSVLTEGLINVRHHAYPPDIDHPEELKRWWLFARHEAPKNKSPGHLYIAIYDIGVGIPSTMRNKLRTGEVVLEMLDKTVEHLLISKGNRLDQALLKAAVEHRRSQTGQAHRGKGLPEMREFIEISPGARLYIVSGKAQYSFVRDRGTAYTTGLVNPFPGTIILWSLPLRPKEAVL